MGTASATQTEDRTPDMAAMTSSVTCIAAQAEVIGWQDRAVILTPHLPPADPAVTFGIQQSLPSLLASCTRLIPAEVCNCVMAEICLHHAAQPPDSLQSLYSPQVSPPLGQEPRRLAALSTEPCLPQTQSP